VLFRVLALWILGSGFVAPLSASDLEAGVAAYERSDFATAFRLLRPLAEQGEPLAQSRLGTMYIRGEGVTRNAEQGDAEAQVTLGLMYEMGIGLRQNAGKAVRWYHLAAAQGHAAAQLALGSAHHQGKGVVKDSAAAAIWYRRAAEQGDPAAQWMLGQMYATGDGIPRDDVKAYAWMRLSSPDTGDPELGIPDELRARMTPEQLGAARRLSHEWRRQFTSN